jgi:hypothetical protein
MAMDPSPRGLSPATQRSGLQDSGVSIPERGGLSARVEKNHSWWQVMCLTGVDYSTSQFFRAALPWGGRVDGSVGGLLKLVMVPVSAGPNRRRLSSSRVRSDAGSYRGRRRGYWHGHGESQGRPCDRPG